MENQFNVWDWKYRIFFDNDCQNKFQNFYNLLNNNEKEFYKKIKDFYMSFFSFGQLFSLIKEEGNNANEYIEKALQNKEKLINLPLILKDFYLNQINKTKYNQEIKRNLIGLLILSIESKLNMHSKYWDLIKELYPKNFNTISSLLNKNSQLLKLPKQKIIRKHRKRYFEKCYPQLINNKFLIDTFGENAIPNFDLEIKNASGYGEWWQKDLIKKEKDKFILYVNKNLKKYDFIYTILHESYPGHGHFYNYVINNKTLFDHGGMILIEGWATYCEWHSLKSKYIKRIRHNAITFLQHSYNYKDNKSYPLLQKNLTRNNFYSQLITHTQFIGYRESYFLGAIFIENIIKNNKLYPKQFLDLLKEKNKLSNLEIFLN